MFARVVDFPPPRDPPKNPGANPKFNPILPAYSCPSLGRLNRFYQKRVHRFEGEQARKLCSTKFFYTFLHTDIFVCIITHINIREANELK